MELALSCSVMLDGSVWAMNWDAQQRQVGVFDDKAELYKAEN